MKRFFSGVGWWLVVVLIGATVFLLFGYGAQIFAVIAPWVEIVVAVSLLIGMPISLLFLIFRKTRGWGGLGIYYISWPLGFWVWLWSLAYAVSVSTFWAVVGVFM